MPWLRPRPCTNLAGRDVILQRPGAASLIAFPICACACVHVRLYVYVYVYVRVRVCVRVCTRFARVCTRVCVHVCVRGCFGWRVNTNQLGRFWNFGAYSMSLSFFHFSEYILTAAFNAHSLSFNCKCRQPPMPKRRRPRVSDAVDDGPSS